MSNPLSSDDPEVWASLIEAAHPASIMVAIAGRLGAELRVRLAPEDIFQETLLKAWRARKNAEWEGTPSFRRWLLRIAQHCIEDHRDRVRSQKRDGDERPLGRHASRGNGNGGPGDGGVEPWGSTTPSRLAQQRELMLAMEAALDTLADDVREVVRLRLFEDALVEEIAARLGLGVSAVRHRFRRGAEQYRQRLRATLGASSIDLEPTDPPRPAEGTPM
jgi:RNA polymerase sigma factor (sigma-70 family)